MALVEKSVLVGHSARQMFDLVDQVERYAQFLPWCGGTAVHSRDEAIVVEGGKFGERWANICKAYKHRM